MSVPRLRPVPDAPERVLGLIRVSKERDGMVSPDVQRVAITDYAAARGYQVDAWLEGLDESGSRARSAWWPRLEQAVGMVEAGVVDVVVVWKYSRVSRNRLRWATAVDRVESAGGRIESATEQVDTSTSTGRFTRGMLAELQAFEAERIGEVWKEIHERRVRSGRPATGKPKYGYLYDRDLKLHVPDPVTGPVLVALYDRYVAGESFFTLVRWLNGHGHRTVAGGLWSDHSLRRVMDAGFASGRFRRGGQLVEGVHEALIDPGTWQAYLDARGRRRVAPARRERSRYVLSGLLRCGRCQGRLVAGQVKGVQPFFRCAAAKEKGPTACRGCYVQSDVVVAQVLAWLRDLAAAVDEAAEAVAGEVELRRTTLQVDRERLVRQISRTEEALTKLVVQNAEDPVPASVYREASVRLGEQLATLRGSLEEVEADARAVVFDPPALAAGLLEEWETLTVGLRRELLRQVVGHVVVYPATGRDVRGRMTSETVCVVVKAWVG